MTFPSLLPDRRASRSDGTGDRWAYRADIDGLRAVAVLLVVSYHVWFGRVSGGVDVFLMLSAFFLTRGFVRRMAGPTPVDPGRHALGVLRRLLPAAAVTLLGVLALTRMLYPQTAWRAVWEQTWASLVYGQNWLLAADAVDYYARSQQTSPLQHFWSLSVQGQAFLLWIALLAVCQLIVRRRGSSPDRVVGVVFGVVFVLSLAYSIVRTTTSQQTAYFDTGARLWEFAAGSLLVVLLPRVRWRSWVAAAAGWAGLGGLLVLGAVVDVRGGFPGLLALWPVLCAAAVVASGEGSTGGPARLLASRPLRWLGRDAYGLYLVHWPILVTWMVVSGRTDPGPLAGSMIVGLSIVAARLLTHLVDAPVRSWRRSDASVRAPLAVIAAASLVVVVPVGAWQGTVAVEHEQAAARVAQTNPGAGALRDPSTTPPDDAPLLPAPTMLDDDWVQLERPCAGPWTATGSVLDGSCFETARTARASRTIAVVGDSHTQQITGALLPLAEQNGWGVVSLVKGACSMGLDEPGDDLCDPWREAALSLIESAAPAAVLTVVTRSHHDELDEAVRPGLERFLDRMHGAGIDVIGVRDNPRFDFDMYGCIDGAEDPAACAVPRAQSLADRNPADDLHHPALRQRVDMTPWLCPDDLCPGVIGNVAVYRDDNHLSGTYAGTLAPSLAEQLVPLWR